MSNDDIKIVWSDELGDLRKKKEIQKGDIVVNEADILLNLRRLTSGKGRTIIEISNLPSNKNWCKKLSKELKQSFGVGGAYKNDFIEVHGDIFDKVVSLLEKRNLKWKKTGG